MRIYQDRFTGCEIISDSYPWTLLYEDTVAEVKSTMKVKGQIVVDVGCGNAFGAKTEEEEEGGKAPQANQNVQKYNDLLDAFSYNDTSFDKQDWFNYFKGFVKRLQDTVYKDKPEAQVEKFKKGSRDFVKFILSKYNDIQIYTPQDQDCENSLIYSLYINEEDEAPHFYYFLPGMKFFKL